MKKIRINDPYRSNEWVLNTYDTVSRPTFESIWNLAVKTERHRVEVWKRCNYSAISSRTCELGTNGCTIRHMREIR